MKIRINFGILSLNTLLIGKLKFVINFKPDRSCI